MSMVIDTRDLQDRIDELESQIEDIGAEITDLEEQLQDEDEDDIGEIKEQIEQLDFDRDDLKVELEELNYLKSEIPEWYDGNALIHEDYWVEYVQDLLEDCGDIPSDLPWYIVVDWVSTAENIAVDYSTIEYDGSTCYYRNC